MLYTSNIKKLKIKSRDEVVQYYNIIRRLSDYIIISIILLYTNIGEITGQAMA